MMIFVLTLVAALIFASAPAQADPISAAIVGFIGLTGTAAAVGTAAITAALSIGASYLANKLLAPKQQKPAGGVELDIRIDADVPQSLIVGRAVTAGSLFYGESHGDKNQHFVDGIAIADHPCEGLVKVFVDGQDESWVAGGAFRGNELTSYARDGREYLHFVFKDGSQTSADSFAVTHLASHPQRPWTSGFVGRGIAYVRTNTMYEPELTPSPMRWRFVVDGIALYDPRKDSTVSGGSGTHRFDDLSTHEFSANLPLIAYNMLRGIRVADHNGDPQHFYGLEDTPAEALPLDVWFAAMNEADVEVDGEPQFHGGAEITVDTEPLETLREIVKACDGRFVEVGGVYKLYVGAPGLPVLAFDDGMVRADEEDVFRPIRPLEQRINHVTGKYTSPIDGWVPKVAPPREFPGGVAIDGRRVSGNLDAPMIQSGNHAQRMMQQMLARARKERRHKLPLPPSCWGLEPGDIVEWTSERNGYVDKLFEVDAVEDYHDLSTTVSLTEVDETDYDWDAATDLIPEADGSLVTDRPDPKVVDGFSVEASLHPSDSGALRPAIRVYWTAPEDADVVAIHVEHRRPSQASQIAEASSSEPEAEELIILSGLQSLTDYEVRGRFQSREGYSTDWSLWMPVTTLDGRIGALDILDNAITAAKINDAAVTAAKLADEAVTLAKFASDLSPVRLVSSLPASGVAGETVYLTTDGKLYVWNGTAWSAEVADASVAAGSITETEIADDAISTPKLAANAVTAAKIAANTITASEIAADTITAGQIAAGAISTDELAAEAVTAAKIAAGTISADLIASKAITAEKLAIANFENLFENGGFETGVLDPSTANGGTGGTWSIASSEQRSGSYALQYDPTGQTANGVVQQEIEVSEGQSVYLEAWAKAGAGTANQARVRIAWFNSFASLITIDNSDDITPTSEYQKLTVKATAPTGAASARPALLVLNDGGDATTYFDDVYLREPFGGELIVDGSITGDHLDVNTITATNIAASTITTDEISVGGVETGNLDLEAATAAASAFTGGSDETVDRFTRLEAQSATITTASDYKVLIMFTAQFRKSSSDCRVTLYIRRDGTDIRTTAFVYLVHSGTEKRITYSLQYVDESPPDGSPTYYIEVQSSVDGEFHISARQLVLTTLKR
ncbi:MAG: phage tail protein [Gammaproteobacteria bacterium]